MALFTKNTNDVNSYNEMANFACQSISKNTTKLMELSNKAENLLSKKLKVQYNSVMLINKNYIVLGRGSIKISCSIYVFHTFILLGR